jgi:hypothetical protein
MRRYCSSDDSNVRIQSLCLVLQAVLILSILRGHALAEDPRPQFLVDVSGTARRTDGAPPIEWSCRRIVRQGETVQVHPDWCMLSFAKDPPSWCKWLEVTILGNVRGGWLVQTAQGGEIPPSTSRRTRFHHVTGTERTSMYGVVSRGGDLVVDGQLRIVELRPQLAMRHAEAQR